MKFDENKAKKIIDKYKLSPVLLRVWKTRGKIPSKYQDPGYTPRVPLSRKSTEFRKLERVLMLEEIQMKAFTTSVIPYQTIIDCFVHNRQTISHEQYLELKSQVVMLRAGIRNHLGKEKSEKKIEQLRNFLWDEPRLRYMNILQNAQLEQSYNWQYKKDEKFRIESLDRIARNQDYYQVTHYLQLLQGKLAL